MILLITGFLAAAPSVRSGAMSMRIQVAAKQSLIEPERLLHYRVTIWPFLKLFARNIMVWPFGLFLAFF